MYVGVLHAFKINWDFLLKEKLIYVEYNLLLSGAWRLMLIGSGAFSAVSPALYCVTWLGRASMGCSWSELLRH